MKFRASFIFKNPLSRDLIVERHYGMSDEEIVEFLRTTLSQDKENFVSFNVEYYFTK